MRCMLGQTAELVEWVELLTYCAMQATLSAARGLGESRYTGDGGT